MTPLFFSSNEEDRLKNPFFLVKLRQLELYTSSRRFPPAVALRCIFLTIQQGPAAHGRAAHLYIVRFLAQSYSEATRNTLLPVLLSAMRNLTDHCLYSTCDPLNPMDQALAWEFTRSVFEATLYGEERSLILADTLLQIFKTDLLVWRATEEKSFPLLLLLAFGGSKDFVPNCCQLVKMLYRARLRGSLAEEKMVLTLLVGLLAIVLEDIEED